MSVLSTDKLPRQQTMSRATIPGALQGLRIVDLSRVLSGPYCTQILADHGADVLKVEPPTGDETRAWGPPFVGDVASYFQGVNRNKRAMCLDLSQPEGRERVLELLAQADVLVENFKAGTMARWGLAYEAISERFPGLVYCSISGFGSDGPLGGLPGYDAAVQAMSGIMSVNGQPDGAATRVGIPIVDMVTGLYATIGIMTALHERERSGRGQHVELSLFDCALSILHPHTANFLASGKVPLRTGNAHPNISPYDTVATRTTPIFLAVGNDRQFRRLCEVLAAPDVADRSEFRSNRDRCTHRVELTRQLSALMREHDGQALVERLMKAGVPCSGVLDVDSALSHPHTLHRRMLVRIENYQGIASPIRLGRTPASYRCKPPRLNEHQMAFDFGPPR
jgi:crotonobetainyl-CoA:carnitine CoA-transferase CaiB-like acyl-CoA transferase